MGIDTDNYTDQVSYKVKKYVTKLKDSSDLNKIIVYQQKLRKYHRIKNKYYQQGSSHNDNNDNNGYNYPLRTENLPIKL